MNEHSTPDWIVNVANVSPFGFVFNRSPVKRYKMSGFDRKLIWLYILGLVRIGLVNRIGSNFLFSFFRNPVVCCLWHGCSRSSNLGWLSPASIDLAISRVFLCVSFPLASNTFLRRLVDLHLSINWSGIFSFLPSPKWQFSASWNNRTTNDPPSQSPPVSLLPKLVSLTLTSPTRLSFVLKVPLRYLLPSKTYSVPCDRIVEKTY